jgi:2-iminobutanoate/2-iminopropanoate deaminase
MWRPFGAFSMAAVQGEGRIVHVKGQVALDEDGRIVGRNDMSAQARKALENIQAVLAAFGGAMGDVFSLAHFVTDIEKFMDAQDVRREFLRPPFPVSTTVQVVRLYDPALLVEIAAIAEIPRGRFKIPIARKGTAG